MKDYIIRASAGNGQIRAFAASTKYLCEYARTLHNTSPLATIGLGRLLTAAGMMGIMMKGEKDLLTIQIKGEGDLKRLLVTAKANGEVKGYAEPPLIPYYEGANHKPALRKAIGEGSLSIIKDLGLKEPYVSTMGLASGEISHDLTYYYAASEQTPTSVALDVLLALDGSVKQAGGFIIQLMPGAKEDTITSLEKNIDAIQLFENCDTAEDLISQLLKGFEIETKDLLETKFICDCSKTKTEKALISLGPKEIKEMIKDGEEINVNCTFCNSDYKFSVGELDEILKNIS